MKVFIESMGCDSNIADTNRIRDFFRVNNIELISDFKQADYIILMSCGFNKIMMNDNLKRLKLFRKTKAKLILGGCIPKIKKQVNTLVDYSFGPKEFDKLQDIFGFNNINEFSPQFTRDDKKIIRISTGCQGNCSYCAIKTANGNVKSRSLKDIKNDILHGLRKGYSKFIFTAEDTGSWGRDIGKSIVDLIESIVKIKRDFKITLTTVNPIWFIEYSRLFDLFQHEKIEKKVYLSLQSGSDRLLKLMNRKYSVKDYISIFNRLKQIPGIKIQTDILVGFPTENKDDFLNTLKIIKELDFYSLQVFVYTDMKGTISDKINPKVPFDIAKKRAKKLIKVFLDKNKCANRKLVNTNINV